LRFGLTSRQFRNHLGISKQPLAAYTVEPGDVLLVTPVDLDSPVRVPADQPVLPDGTINLGKFGHLRVMGRTVPEIEEAVKTAIRTQSKDSAIMSVRLISRQSKVYYVIGEVNSPGSFQLNGRETVLDALMQAGGLTDQASRDNIVLSRPTKPNCPRIVLPVCWKQIVQLGDTTTNYQLAPGDRIYVPSRRLCEQIPLLNRWVRSPCNCGNHVPESLPSYQGESCPSPASVFSDRIETTTAPIILPPPKSPWTPLPQ
jgi:polysaccharide biosynthesis/export protein